MATTLTNNLLAFYFSCQLPDLEWNTDSESLTVSLYCPSNGGDLLVVNLAAVGGKVKLWEVRETVERWMRHRNRPVIPLVVRWKEASAGGYQYANATPRVYYCSEAIGESCSNWFQYHFFSTATEKILPVDGATERLYFTNPYNFIFTPKALVTYRLQDGTVRGEDLDLDNVQAVPGDVSLVSFTVDALRARVEALLETSVEVIAVTVRVGQRSMVYYKPELPATAAFAFMNMFGVTEVAWLHCATTTKRKDGRKIANVARRAAVYDMDLEVTHEVETAPLPLATAQWLAQLVTSPKVWLADGTPVIITDGTSEVNDDHSVMNTVKFTWKRDDNRGTLGESAEDIQIFTQPPFSFQFD